MKVTKKIKRLNMGIIVQVLGSLFNTNRICI